jgi:hypothetical protein
MKKLFTLLSLTLLTYLIQAQANISYTVSTSGNCFPMTVTINISSDDPSVTFFRVNKDFPYGGWDYGYEAIAAGNPYSFITNSSINTILGIQAANNTGVVGELYDNYTVSGNQYTLTTQTSLPYSVPVGQAFPIQLTSNDQNITSIEWDFGNGQNQVGGTSVSPTYTQAGTYLVTCTLTSSECGIVEKSIEVIASNIQANFPETICVGTSFNVTFSGVNPATTSYMVSTPDNGYFLNTPQIELTYWSNGQSYLEIYCYDGDGNLVDYINLPVTVSGVSHYIEPGWIFVRAGDPVNYELKADDDLPIEASNITWSFGGNGATVSHAFTDAGYFPVKAYFLNTCSNQADSVSANVLVSDAQVTVNTEDCAPASFNIGHSGEDYFGIISMRLWNGSGVDESFSQVDEFDYNFTTSGDYTVTVQYALGDMIGSLNFPIYIPGPSVGAATVTACGSYLFGEGLLTSSGVYNGVFQSMYGCDSTVTLNLTIVPDFTVSIANNIGTLTATGGGTTFKWFNCTTGEYIQGATSATFTPEQSGFYGVVAMIGDCSDSTEVCVEVTGVNVGELAVQTVQMYPNPAQGNVRISNAIGSLCMIYDARGKLVHSTRIEENDSQINLNHFEAGIYVVNIALTNGRTEQQRLVVVK